ncbi:uncharacterized protein LOC121390588 [Gigantopelta aegis]|uniref:uncharacterized protein LOC121390588 n=1 Tax=Gigantopelta aegis TaxID=1735272 RepID=UPI001B88A934|nr:uncharacterized protein LOC121390588 [Gigantopelta aegis]
MTDGRTSNILRAWRIKENMEEICKVYEMIREKKQELIWLTEEINSLVRGTEHINQETTVGNSQLISFAGDVYLQKKYFDNLNNSSNQLSQMRQKLHHLLQVTNSDVDLLLKQNTKDCQRRQKDITARACASDIPVIGSHRILKSQSATVQAVVTAKTGVKSDTELVLSKLKQSTGDLKGFYGDTTDLGLLEKAKKKIRRSRRSENAKEGFFQDFIQLFSCIRWTYLAQTMGIFVFWPDS